LIPFLAAWSLNLVLLGIVYWDTRKRNTTDWNLLGLSVLPFYGPYYWWRYLRPAR
jgi:hypothetical protein